MGDYSGFATLGDIITGGARREAEANYPKYLAEAAGYGKALDVAAQERAKRLARDVVGEKYRAWAASQGLSPEAADLGATYATGGNMNLNTQIAGSERLQDMGFDRLIDEALLAGDQKRAQQLSAVKTDHVLPTLGAGGKVVFTPVTGGVELTNLGDAALGAENALAEQRAAAANSSMRRASVAEDRAGVYRGTQEAKLKGNLQTGVSKAIGNIRSIEHDIGRPLSDQEVADYIQTGQLSVPPERAPTSIADVVPSTGYVSFDDIPESAKAKLAEGKRTTFGNGQVWTLVHGQPTRVK